MNFHWKTIAFTKSRICLPSIFAIRPTALPRTVREYFLKMADVPPPCLRNVWEKEICRHSLTWVRPSGGFIWPLISQIVVVPWGQVPIKFHGCYGVAEGIRNLRQGVINFGTPYINDMTWPKVESCLRMDKTQNGYGSHMKSRLFLML